MKFTIDRKTWLRGTGGSDSMLRDDSGLRCCLGFYVEACGVSKRVTHEMGTPYGLICLMGDTMSPRRATTSISRIPKWLLKKKRGKGGVVCNDSTDSEALMRWNDDTSVIDESVRESAIASIFARHGVAVEFR